MLKRVIQLRKKRKLKAALSLINQLLKEHSNNANMHLQKAFILDNMGREKEAITFYKSAIKKGYKGNELKHAFLGLSSSYRVIGEYKKAFTTIKKGIRLFPHNRALKVFQALILYNLKKHKKAMQEILILLIDTTSDTNIISYKTAILYYSNKLDRINKY